MHDDDKIARRGGTSKRVQHLLGEVVLDDGTKRPCIVWSFSATGAQISAETVDDIPNEFILLLARYGMVHRRCTIVSRIDNKIRVNFAPEPMIKHEHVQTKFV
jgi:hypothetical protein